MHVEQFNLLSLLQDATDVSVDFSMVKQRITISTPSAADNKPLAAVFEDCVTLLLDYEPERDGAVSEPWENSIINYFAHLPTTRLKCERVAFGFDSGAELDIIFRRLAVTRLGRGQSQGLLSRIIALWR